jgi:hypothetical protein
MKRLCACVHVSLSLNHSTSLYHLQMVCWFIYYAESLYMKYNNSAGIIWYITLLCRLHRNWDSSVGILTGYGLDGVGSIPGRGKNFLFFTACRPTLGPSQPPIQWVLGALSPGVKWQGREADHLPPSSVKVKKGGAIPPLPHMSSWHST